LIVANADRIIKLLHEAKAQPAGAERARFLAEACGDDAVLKEQIVSLLEADADDSESDFLSSIPVNREPISATEKPGDRIGHYKLLEQIGEGGCGVVYMAEQLEPVRRRVALKVIKLGMDTKQVIARFEAERQALAMMDHPNIAKVFDGGATGTGRPYFVMELVRGVCITRFCDEARLPTQERLRLFIRVCQAVQHAHQKGIIHRDLKPSNILVTVNDGQPVPKVIDFGIAKATEQRLTDKTLFTQFHSFLGTPAYVSPEQVEMSSVDVDTRSDIYSLGVLLYELLTGKPPFDGEALLRSGLEEMRRTIRETPPATPSNCLSTLGLAEATALSGKRQASIHGLAGAVRGDLDWIVMKCLEKDRSRRYETANGLAMDIQRHLHNEPVIARPPSRWYEFQKTIWRHKFGFAAAAVVILVLAAGVLVSTSTALYAHRQTVRAIKAETSTREQLFVSLQSQAQARRNSRQPGQRIESLAALAEAARIRPTQDLRDNAIAAMAVPDIEQGPVWPVQNTDAKSFTYDSHFQHCARLRQDGTISIRTIPDDREVQRLESNPSTRIGSAGGQLTFSPDGHFLARLAESGKLWVWQWESGESVLKSPPEKCSGALAFSPDSRRLAIGHEDWITCFDLSTGEASHRWQARDRAYRMVFHPDSRKIAVGYFETNLVSIYNADDGGHLTDLPTGASSQTIVAWHPEGNLLATGGSDPRIQIWDVKALRKLAVLEGHVQQVTSLTFHPGGDLLVSSAWDGPARLWQPSPGRLLMRLSFPAWISFSSEGGRWAGVLSPSNHQTQLWGIVQSQEYHTFLNPFPSGTSWLHEGDISADGTVLALGTSDGVRLWDVAHGREVAWLSMGDTTCALFQADSRGLLTCGPDDGLRRWSIATNTKPEGGLQLGPFHQIELPFAPLRMAKGRGDRTLAVVGERTGQCAILDLATESVRVAEMSHALVAFVALSPDSERLATSGWHSEQVKLWDGPSGKLLKELKLGSASRVFFTPDNRELMVSRGDEFTFYTLDSLAVTRRLPRAIGLYPGHAAFTADGKMMALEMAPGVIHLKEITSGRTVAKLEDPQGDVSTWMSFTPDGTQLVVAALYAGAIHRWDLRAIREHLKTMGLDWDWPAFSAAEPGGTLPAKGTQRLRIQVLDQKPPGPTPPPATKASAAKP
jgi:serine/threonine protein kinase/WD40 repeat protein